MELTPDKVKELLNLLLMMAKENRAKIPYSNVDGFSQAVVLLGPNLELATMPITWRNEQEKYARMDAVSKVARDTFSQAVCLISDTRWVEEANIVKILGVRPSAEIGLEVFQNEYRRIVHERYKGYLGNAPKELFTEAIMIAMKGPRLGGPQAIFAPYDEGPNDSIHWLPRKPDERVQTQHFNLLPDWWV